MHVRYALCAVDEHGNAVPFCARNDIGQRIHRPERVRYVTDAEQLDAFVHQREQLLEIDIAVVVDFRDNKFRAGLFADQLPWNDVRVMFETGDQDPVAARQQRSAETLCDQVDRLGRPAGQHDLRAAGRVDEGAQLVAGAFVELRCAMAQRMHTAMDVGVIVAVIVRNRFDDGRGLLGGTRRCRGRRAGGR